jgi:hypothetical protein
MCKQESNKILLWRKKKQSHNKIMYPKLMLNKLKVIGNPTSIYTHSTLSSKKFLKKLPIYMWPMFAHVRSCVTHVWIMNELKLN